MRPGNATGIVLNVLAVASLLACAGTVALWVRSHRPAMTASSVDSIDLTTREPLWWVVCNRGRFTLCRQVGHDWDRPRQVLKVLGLELAGSRVGGSSLYNLFVPYWMVVGATLCLPVLAGVRSMRVRRRARWRREGRCVGCGYDLTGNASGVCPECGTKVE